MRNRNPISFLIFFLLVSIACFGQRTNTPGFSPRANQSFVVEDGNLSALNALFVPRYWDTTEANAYTLKDTLGNVVFTYSSMSLWVRSLVGGGKRWVEVGSGGGSPGWSLTGNSGLSASNFLGLTDSSGVGIPLRVGNVPHGAIGYEYQATNNPYSHYRPHQVGIVAIGSYAGDSAIKDLRAGISDRTQITAIGSGALQNNVADANTAVGSSSMNRMVTGRRNTAVGVGTLWDTKTGRFNTAFGTFALEVQDGVDESSAFGHEALRSNKNGVRNAAFGTYALTFNTTYVDTIIITNPGSGYTLATITIAAADTATPGAPSTQATATAVINSGQVVGVTMTNKGRGYNIKDGPVTVTITGDGTGATATATLSSGESNTGVGFMALYNSRYGKRNTAVGTYSGMGASGVNFRSLYDDDMTLIGYNARRHSGRANTVPYSNGTAIGSGAIVGCDNCLILGDSSLTNVGIGTAFVNHSARFQINSTTKGALLPRMNTTQMNAISSPAAGLLLYNTDSNSYVQYNGSAWQNLYNTTGGSGSGISEVIADYGLFNVNDSTIAADTTVLTTKEYVDSAIIVAKKNIIVASDGTTGEDIWRESGDSLYLAQLNEGSNVTLTKETDGSITIAATGGGGGVDSIGAKSRGIIQAATYTLTSTSALQRLFNVDVGAGAGAIPVSANTTYKFRCFFALSDMSSTSGNAGFDVLGAGTATVTNVNWQSVGRDGVVVSNVNGLYSETAAQSGNIVSATNTTGMYVVIEGIIRINTAGTLIPSVNLTTAAAAVVGINSNFELTRIGNGSVTSW